MEGLQIKVGLGVSSPDPEVSTRFLKREVVEYSQFRRHAILHGLARSVASCRLQSNDIECLGGETA